MGYKFRSEWIREYGEELGGAFHLLHLWKDCAERWLECERPGPVLRKKLQAICLVCDDVSASIKQMLQVKPFNDD